jgi:hypothetical protein
MSPNNRDFGNGRPDIQIGRYNNIRWHGPENSAVYAQVDNQAEKVFARGASGNDPASWIMNGHLYTFMLRDANGREIARDQLDLRPSRPGPLTIDALAI